MSRKPSLWRRAANTTLADLGHVLTRKMYAMTREHALLDLAQTLGVHPNVLTAAAQKDYSEVGQTEISARLGSQFADQPQQNLQILAKLYETHPWVFICSSYIATQLAAMPLRIMRATGFEDGREVLEGADETPVGMMYRWINPLQSPNEFVEHLASWLLLTGEAYIAYASPGPDTPRGIPAEMYVLFPPFVRKVTSPSKGLLGYVYNVSGEQAFFDRSDVAYIGSFSPSGRFKGQGTPTASIQTIATDEELRDFNRNVLKQGVHLSGTLESENEDLGKDDADMIRGSFEKQYSGSQKAAKIAVLWGGLKFNPHTIMQKDVMMDTQLTAHRDEIIATFGLKPELLTEKFANKATAETVRRMALEDTVLGRYGKRIESALSATGLMRFDSDLRARFDTSEVPGLQTSQKEKADTGQTLIASGQMTPNEVRTRIHGLEPIDGVEGDILYLGNSPAAASLGVGDVSDESSKLLLPGTAAANSLAIAASMNVVVKSAESDFRIVFERNRQAAQNRLDLAMRSLYKDLQREVMPLASRSVTNSEMLAAIEQVYYFDGRKEAANAVGDAVRKSAEDSVAHQLAAMKIETVFDIKPVRALRRLASQEQRIRNSTGKSWLKLRSSLQEGLSLGESEAEMTKRVSAHFRGLRNNAATIARTETLPAINGAAVDAAEEATKAGVYVLSTWVTSGDELVRTPPRDSKDHRAANGQQIIPGQEMFVVSGQRLEYPGDSWNGASADNTINCRCGVMNEVMTPEEARARGLGR